ncbi:MAG: ribonuclease III [Chromatiaceae bacterium]
MTEDLRGLARALGCRIGRTELFAQALTHRSAAANNNERLEFMGDALLGFVIAEALWERFPDADEGRLSRLRASLVKKESLAGLARGLGLSDYLRLGAGELRTGGYARDSILADALEAVLAAVYLDEGFAGARQVILAVFREALEATGEAGTSKDPKTRLQEKLQARRRPLPEYEVLAVTGRQHAQTFRVRCNLVDDSRDAEGEGSSRRRAEQQAAQRMLALLEAEA